MLYSIGKFAKEIGVTTTTLRNWDKSGELKPCKVTDGGTRYYSEQHLISIIHIFSCRIYGLRKYKKEIKDDKKC